MRRLIVLFAMLVACGSPPQASRPSSPSPTPPPAARPPVPVPDPPASTIVAKMHDVYSTATSYVDHGDVSTVVSNRRVTDSQFDIAFVRDGVLRYEFRSKGRSYLVWWDGNVALTQWDSRVEKTTLEAAINNPRGVSRPSADSVPSMLLPGLFNRSWFAMLRDLQVLGTERIAERDCWKLAGKYSANSSVIFWVDRETFLLRRTEIHVHIQIGRMSTFTTDSTTNHNPVINGPLDTALLKPP